jgi:hypothetical protein
MSVIATVTRDASKDKYVCTINGEPIGESKHKDYFEFHYRRGDITGLMKHDIGGFQYLNDDGTNGDLKPAVRGEPKVKKAKPAQAAEPQADQGAAQSGQAGDGSPQEGEQPATQSTEPAAETVH